MVIAQLAISLDCPRLQAWRGSLQPSVQEVIHRPLAVIRQPAIWLDGGLQLAQLLGGLLARPATDVLAPSVHRQSRCPAVIRSAVNSPFSVVALGHFVPPLQSNCIQAGLARKRRGDTTRCYV
ncbi:MAG: hypothetical protein QXS54_07415 [Candidatus Methanomethylicaceae archaeon]